jgi:mono/diheme cytochrome c family protein
MLQRLILAGGLLVILASALVGAGAGGVAPAGIVATSTAPAATPQLAEGYQLYRLWCVSCHGDDLRGLTPEWIAKWPATHQNCWVAKCHGSNPPPDGFTIPKTAPAIAGAGALLRFRTAGALHAYVRAVMPFQEPGVLDDDQYWAIIAYVLDIHGMDLPPGDLSADSGGGIVIHEGASPVSEVSPAQAEDHPVPHTEEDGTTGLIIAAAAAVVGTALGLILPRRRSAPPRQLP